MKEQNYSNHIRFSIGHHFVIGGLMTILFITAVYNLIVSLKSGTGISYGIMFLIISIIIILQYYYVREFPLKAQDRAIRAEENLRHFSLTGKLLDPGLKISQITALRFAPDREFIDLSQKAIDEDLSAQDIKKQIKDWKPDNHRV